MLLSFDKLLDALCLPTRFVVQVIKRGTLFIKNSIYHREHNALLKKGRYGSEREHSTVESRRMDHHGRKLKNEVWRNLVARSANDNKLASLFRRASRGAAAHQERVNLDE